MYIIKAEEPDSRNSKEVDKINNEADVESAGKIRNSTNTTVCLGRDTQRMRSVWHKTSYRNANSCVE